MRTRLNENLEIGNEVYVPRDEYVGTVIDIDGDEVLIDGPFGEEYFDINDLKKLGGDYEEEDLAPSFREKFMESRKKTMKLTERDLSRIVRRVIKESDIENSELCLGLISDVIVNNFSDILDEAKMKLEDNGGTFENGETPNENDWKRAEDALMQALIDAKV
jgi:hypothetical protein